MDSGEPTTTRATRALTRRRSRAEPDAAGAPFVLDRYRLTRRLGTGAFGTVWMARDERLDRDVAVKILARERIVGGRFEREARAAARLSHPAIVTLYEAAVDDEGAYLVSELVRGATLDALLAEGRLSDRDIVSVAIALCDALEHAHGQGVVHRDVKPSNILVPDAPASAAQVAKLTDFGVARVVGGDSLTITGDVIGTLAYMAPEQAEGLETGPAADLYSLALVVYEALTGVNPLAAAATQRSRRLGAHLPPLRRQRRDLPRALGLGIDLALRPRPRERGTVGELRDALRAVTDEVGDEPGVVAGAVSPWTTFLGRADGAEEALGEDEAPAVDAEAIRRQSTGSWPRRAAAGAAAAALTAWLLGTALAPAPVAPAAAALLAGAAVLVLPRIAWGAILISVCATALIQGHPGMAVVLLIGLLVPAVLLPARPTLWPVAAAAPALGLIGLAGLAGAWPALAGRAATVWRRAILAAVGWTWLLLAAPIAGRGLYLPLLPGTPPPAQWTGSMTDAAGAVLGPLASPAVLGPAAVWAAGAVVLPWLVRDRRPAAAVGLTVLWSAVVAGLIAPVMAAGHPPAGLAGPPGLVIGAVAAGLVALVPSAPLRLPAASTARRDRSGRRVEAG
ncbi:MAG TPA: serine/threonine-protein kinase [Solirubrobacteraceae bacterium]|nr:serine/threonine-protein kinase [Solirubrobacteraceae bacterium]